MNAVQSSPTLSTVMLRTSFTFCSMLRHIHEGPVRAWPEANGTLLKEAPEAEPCIHVDLVVGGFSGVFHPAHALLPLAWDVGVSVLDESFWGLLHGGVDDRHLMAGVRVMARFIH